MVSVSHLQMVGLWIMILSTISSRKHLPKRAYGSLGSICKPFMWGFPKSQSPSRHGLTTTAWSSMTGWFGVGNLHFFDSGDRDMQKRQNRCGLKMSEGTISTGSWQIMAPSSDCVARLIRRNLGFNTDFSKGLTVPQVIWHTHILFGSTYLIVCQRVISIEQLERNLNMGIWHGNFSTETSKGLGLWSPLVSIAMFGRQWTPIWGRINETIIQFLDHPS
jgi:hypothetical protein